MGYKGEEMGIIRRRGMADLKGEGLEVLLRGM